MRTFSTFSALWRAPLFQKAFYQDVGLHWRGIGILFLLLLLLVTWVPTIAQWTLGFSRFVTNEAPAALADFPPITIAAGKASSPAAQPYIMKDDAGRPFFVLDTTGATKNPSEHGARLLLTETEFVQDDGRRVERRPLSTFPDMTIDRATILSWLKTARNFFFPAALLFLGLFSLVYRLVVALVFAGIAMALNAAFKGTLTFAGAMRLAIVSMTASIILDTLLGLFSINFGCFSWIFFHALTFGYLVFGVKAVADVSKPVVGFPVNPNLDPRTGPDALFP